jgi:NAD(P)-dependent dehydrogenase (short-subunit alcohol dehydrogenase family)
MLSGASILITGANRGLGLEMVRQLAARYLISVGNSWQKFSAEKKFDRWRQKYYNFLAKIYQLKGKI